MRPGCPINPNISSTMIKSDTHAGGAAGERLLITIDGPAGAGKTTVSRMLAERLAYTYVDTGALYRAIAFAARDRGVGADDDAALEKLCTELNLELVRENSELRLIVDSQDITHLVRTPEITMLASAVSARPVVRSYLLGLQRELGRARGAVFEGRDMGTVVFPDADVKFYLDASPKARAYRRYMELKVKSSQSLADVEKDLIRRDHNDSTRKAAPLKPAPGAIKIDCTDRTAEQVVDHMFVWVNKLTQSEK